MAKKSAATKKNNRGASSSSNKKQARVPRKRKTDPAAPGADLAGIGHNQPPVLTDAEQRKLFVHHRSAWNAWQAKVKQAAALGKEVKEALKNDGFSIKQMQIADDLAADDEKTRKEIDDRLRVASWLGLPLGSQLDMFAQPDRTPLVDRAFEEGKQASIENRPAKPPYDPDTEAFRHYMAGYHEHQRELVGGMKAADNPEDSAMASTATH